MFVNSQQNVHFIYRPNSGDRVFAISYPEELIKEYKNGCRHVAGYRLNWDLGSRERRHKLSKILKVLCEVTPGIAWDDKGTISYCAPSAGQCARTWRFLLDLGLEPDDFAVEAMKIVNNDGFKCVPDLAADDEMINPSIWPKVPNSWLQGPQGPVKFSNLTELINRAEADGACDVPMAFLRSFEHIYSIEDLQKIAKLLVQGSDLPKIVFEYNSEEINLTKEMVSAWVVWAEKYEYEDFKGEELN